MSMKLIEITQELCSASFVSGFEILDDNNVIVKYLERNKIPFKMDNIGNVIFEKEGHGNGILMLVAHYDEIGFSIKFIDDNGFIYFSTIGGVDITMLRGQKVNIYHEGNAISGVIGARPAHMIHQERNKNNSIDISDLWIDIGARSKKDAEHLVSVGDPISFCPNFTELGNNLFTSKSIDNRSGVASLFAVHERIKEETIVYQKIYFVLSAQEELGMRGARVAGYAINPDICIAVDVTHATDYPTINKRKFGEVSIGQGAVIPIGSNFSIPVQKFMKRIATEKKINFQTESTPSNSGTDIAEVQMVRDGCKSGLISIPCRYMHTPTEIASYNDLQSVIDILSALCTSKLE